MMKAMARVDGTKASMHPYRFRRRRFTEHSASLHVNNFRKRNGLKTSKNLKQ